MRRIIQTTMIDTVVINLQPDSYRLLDKRHTIPWQLHSQREGYQKYVKTLSKKQREDGKYRPRIRGISRAGKKSIQVELSLPKALFGNNIDELCNENFPTILKTLSEMLLEQGVVIGPKQIAKCSLSAVHYSKNILLERYTVEAVLNRMAQAKVPGYVDTTKDRYMNAGHVLHYYTKAHSLVGYDKLNDIRKTKSRAIDKDQTPQQRSLLCKKPEISNNQILRLEVRLSQKRKLQEVLKPNKAKESVTLEEAFSEEIAMKVMNEYWEELIEVSTLTFMNCKSPNNILRLLLHDNAPRNAKDAIYLTSLCLLAQDSGGLEETRNIIEKHFSSRTWYRISADCARINAGVVEYQEDWVKQVRSSITNYKPFKLNH